MASKKTTSEQPQEAPQPYMDAAPFPAPPKAAPSPVETAEQEAAE